MTNKSEMPDLLPCPFCGADAYYRPPISQPKTGSSVCSGFVECRGCGCAQDTPEQWNRRSDLHQSAIEKAINCIKGAIKFDESPNVQGRLLDTALEALAALTDNPKDQPCIRGEKA